MKSYKQEAKTKYQGTIKRKRNYSKEPKRMSRDEKL